MSANDIATFEKWVAYNAQRHTAQNTHLTTETLRALATMAAEQPVVANSKLVGQDAQQALAGDQEFMKLRHAAEGPKHLALLPATGCAMILSLAQKASGYNPSSPGAAGNLQGFVDYVEQVIACPALDATIHDTVKKNWSNDWKVNIKNIVSYYKGIAPVDLKVIQKSLWTLAKAAASSPNTNEKDNLFVQSTLNCKGEVNIYIYMSMVVMKLYKRKDKGKHAPTVSTGKASFTLWRTVLKFNQALWPEYSKIIIAKTDASLHSWLADNSTPQGKVPVNWDCL